MKMIQNVLTLDLWNSQFCKMLLFVVILIFNPACPLINAQPNEKSISNQSLLIDALREEQINNVDNAIEILEKLKYEPEFKEVSYYLLAKLYMSQQKTNQALNAIEQSLSIDSKNKWYLVLKANLTEHLGDYKFTALTYLELVSLEPENYTFYDNAAFFFLKAQLPNDALKVINTAEEYFGLTPQIALKKTHIFKTQLQFTQAIEVLVSCLSTYPSHTELKEEISKLIQEITDENSRNALFEKYPELHPEKNEIEINDINQLRTLVQSSKVDLDTKIKKFVQVLSDEKQQDHYYSLIPVAEILLNQYPSDPKTSCLLADIYFLKDQFNEAVKFYNKAQKLGPVPFSIWSNLLYCLNELNRWPELRSSSELCLEYYPNQSLPYISLAKAYIELNKFDQALHELERLEPMTKYNKQKRIEFLRMKLIVQESMQQDVTELMEEANELHATNCFLIESMLIRCKKGIIPDSDHIKSASEQCPDHDPAKAFYLSQIYWYTGNLDQSLVFIKKALNNCNYQNPSVLKFGINLFNQMGDAPTATQLTLKLEQVETPLD